ncbi:MAG TPA: type II toxin-antitoxin system Phd/YefM family antitoxin [Verrucomicrobiales bacterium]|nr:type II toxin-antitoxin system Phd/YefM family antitoxin [Verrucomicrobiales bacterium]
MCKLRIMINMKKTITSTEAVRRFGKLLVEVGHTQQPYIITRNGRPIVELMPIKPIRENSLGNLVETWLVGREGSDASKYANDLQSVQDTDQPASNPWE